MSLYWCILFALKVEEEDQAAEEEEEDEGEEVEGIKAEVGTKAKRRNMIVMMTTMVSAAS